MIAADVMTRNVLSVTPDSSVEDAAKLMLGRGISGLFVVTDSGDLAGVVTEGDLLRREELGTERSRPWWLRLLVSPGRQAADFTHAHGRRVRDVMTASVISVADDADLNDVVDIMEENRIKRVAVTRNKCVVGVVSRSDLLRALVGRAAAAPPVKIGDRALRTAILDALDKTAWGANGTVNVTVEDGAVDVWGTIVDEGERRAIFVTIENVPGVKSVRDRVVFVEPYSGTVIESPDTRT